MTTKAEAKAEAFRQLAPLLARYIEPVDGPGVVVGVDVPALDAAAAPPATARGERLSVGTDQDVRAPGSPARQPARARTSTSP